MKSDEIIIRYLDNQMPAAEKIEFEEKLKASPELLEKLNKMQSRLDSIKLTSLPETDETYFSEIIPRFREKQEKKKINFVPSLGLRWAAGLVTIIILSTLLIINTGKEEKTDLASMDTNEIKEAYNYYRADENLNTGSQEVAQVISEKIDSLIAEEYILSDSSELYLDQSDYNSLVASLTDDEADKVYNQLINKNFNPGGGQ